jgi:hypothetical protein
MQIIKIFPKTLSFFTILFNQANDIYVKIYETAQLTMFYAFLIKKQIFTLSLRVYCWLIWNSIGLIVTCEIPCIHFSIV